MSASELTELLNRASEIAELLKVNSASERAAYIQHEMPWYGEFGHKENLKMIVKELEKMIYEKAEKLFT